MESGKRAGRPPGIYRRGIWRFGYIWIYLAPSAIRDSISSTCLVSMGQSPVALAITTCPTVSDQALSLCKWTAAQPLLLHLRLRLQLRHDGSNSAFSQLHPLSNRGASRLTCYNSGLLTNNLTSSHQQTRRITTPAASCLSLRPHGEASLARAELLWPARRIAS